MKNTERLTEYFENLLNEKGIIFHNLWKGYIPVVECQNVKYYPTEFAIARRCEVYDIEKELIDLVNLLVNKKVLFITHRGVSIHELPEPEVGVLVSLYLSVLHASIEEDIQSYNCK